MSGLGSQSRGGVWSVSVFFRRSGSVSGAWGKVILARSETSPDDIKGMIAAEGILTTRGGITSHAAVVARSMGKCCVVGCDEIILNEEEGQIKFTGRSLVLKRGDYVSMDGSTGDVFLGSVRTQEPQLDQNFMRFYAYCREIFSFKSAS